MSGWWFPVLLLIASVYLLIVAIKAVRDLIIWYREGRTFAVEQKRARALRRQQRAAAMPALKERPTDPSKPPIRDTQPPIRDTKLPIRDTKPPSAGGTGR